MSCWAIIAAAGSGSRMGGQRVKVLQDLNGRPVICYSVEKFLNCCDGVIVAARDADVSEFARVLGREGLYPQQIVRGGRDRRETVWLAMQELPEDCDLVLVHDGARPLVSEALIRRVMESARYYGSGVPALPLTDTLKRVDWQGQAVETVDRHILRAVQTPQGFVRALLVSAHDENPSPASDDASLVEQLDVPVHLVEGEESNIKITFPGDLQKAERYLIGPPLHRAGMGYDIHRLIEGRPLVLGGVTVPFEKGLLGHSDADVVTHALMDALLGAAALGDIGTHFPDTDPAYGGANSVELLQRVCALLQERRYRVCNADIVIAAERPRLMPYLPQMQRILAEAMGIPDDRVSLKATTTEGLGPEGRGEGISARAVALIIHGVSQA